MNTGRLLSKLRPSHMRNFARNYFFMLRNLRWYKYRQGHVFEIRVDDISYKMTFLDYFPLFPLSRCRTIIERIEGRREPETMAIMRTLIKEGSKVLEIGACYGEFTAIMAICAGPGGKVVSIEGTPNNFRILKENIRLNNLTNVEAHNFFVTTRSSSVVYGPQEQNNYAATRRQLAGQTTPVPDAVIVPGKKLTGFLEETGFSPEYIFMDIEGYEVDVFEDFSEGYLKSHRPVIVFEIHPSFYRNMGKGLDFITDVLKKNNYRYRNIAGNLVCFPD